RAGRPRRDLVARLVQRQHDEVGAQAVDTEQDVAGQPFGADRDYGHRADTGLEAVTQLAPPVRTLAGGGQGGGEPDDAGDVLRAGTVAGLLPTAPDQRPEPRGVSGDEHADALRALHLVG